MQTNQKSFRKIFIALTVTALLFSACGEKPQQPPAPQIAPAQPDPAKLFQQERSALDKAKAIEQTVQKSSEESGKEMERQAQ